MSEKSKRREDLFYKQKNGYDRIDAKEKAKCDAYCEEYKAFLDSSMTEREAVRSAIALAEKAGFKAFVPGRKLKAGDKVYYSNRGKAIMLAVIGKKSFEEGCVIAAAHVDSPRLDLKQLPLYESEEMALFKTHYYGGIKKYQWTTIPLELHGVVALQDGSVVDVVIGRDESDPQFVITDLLPHLAADQLKKSAAEVISGESLNILIGSVPDAEEGSDRVKLAVLKLLEEKYGIREEDFLSAELSAVPAYRARDIGLDRSLIGAYGHDDRSCAFAELKAILEVKKPERSCVCIFADKEEVGSMGVSGMQSQAFEYFMGELCAMQGVDLRRCFAKSVCISADVCNALDPNYPEVSERRNNAKLNYGVGICKFTGARGKSGANDASAELVGRLRAIFADAGVVWQMAELGKVDQGGGGTVAAYMADRNIETIDAGVPVLSMHAPFETVGKFDCYMTYKAVLSVFNS